MDKAGWPDKHVVYIDSYATHMDQKQEKQRLQ